MGRLDSSASQSYVRAWFRKAEVALFAWILASLCMPSALGAQQADPWTPIRFLEGAWRGTSEGEPGKGAVERSYTFVLKQRFIHEKNVSTYPAQGNKPSEVHEHWSFFSHDRKRDVLVLRQFHQEGFVNEFVMTKSASTPTRLVFESETLENLGRWRARETYEVISNDEFIETFEIGAPGKPLHVYSKNHFKRVTRGD
ncbi:MAG TPA: hypothetical protein VJ717_04905 [Gemmatimonadaceae bacterium]|nr:hypothetical protein [Gemmatimonadaceae bacterium]